MQRIVSYAWVIGPLAVLLAQVSLFSGCMSLRHKVDPVSITLNVKLENVDSTGQATTGPSPAAVTASSLQPKYRSD